MAGNLNNSAHPHGQHHHSAIINKSQNNNNKYIVSINKK